MTETTEQRTPLIARILEVIIAGRGMPVFLDTIISTTGFNKTQVQTATWRMAKKDANIEVVISGNAWRYVQSADQVTHKPVRKSVRKPVRDSTDDTTPRSETPAVKSLNGATPTLAPGGRLFEELIQINDNTSVIRDQNGIVYTAVINQFG